MKAELVEGLVERVSREEMVRAIREMKVGKVAGPLQVSVEMIAASGEIGIGVMVEHAMKIVEKVLERRMWRMVIWMRRSLALCQAKER